MLGNVTVFAQMPIHYYHPRFIGVSSGGGSEAKLLAAADELRLMEVGDKCFSSCRLINAICSNSSKWESTQSQ